MATIKHWPLHTIHITTPGGDGWYVIGLHEVGLLWNSSLRQRCPPRGPHALGIQHAARVCNNSQGTILLNPSGLDRTQPASKVGKFSLLGMSMQRHLYRILGTTGWQKWRHLQVNRIISVNIKARVLKMSIFFKSSCLANDLVSTYQHLDKQHTNPLMEDTLCIYECHIPYPNQNSREKSINVVT